MYYRPNKKSVCADVIPYYKNGIYYLYYLKDYRDIEKHGEGVSWFLLKTKDFVNYKECGEILPKGSKDDHDLYVFTGSIIEKDNKYYIFYTGHNPHLVEKNKPQQVVLLAVGDSLRKYKKTDFMLKMENDDYEIHDFRDPFVYKDGDMYKMLLTCRKKNGPFLRRGVTLSYESKDLLNWQLEKEFYAPNNYYAHECPDLFKMGDWWYLVFSEFSDNTATKYRMCKNLGDEWITPKVDTFDARCFYAAKTVSNGDKRYIIGWISTKEDEIDEKGWQWGGSIAVHEIIQNEDGTLSVINLEDVRNQYIEEIELKETVNEARYEKRNKEYHLKKGGYSYILFNELPKNGRITCKIKTKEKVGGFGFALRMDLEYNKGYYVKFNTKHNRMCFTKNFRQGDNPYENNSERFIEIADGKEHFVEIMIEDTIVIVYVDGVAMSHRLYEHREGAFGIYVNDTEAWFSDIRIYK
jgi:beta-fructofuranosidase